MNNPSNLMEVLGDLIRSIKPSEFLTQNEPDYAYHSSTFSAHREQRPSLVFAPESTESLSRIISVLYKTDIDFDIRGHGFKSSSGAVVVSMINFRDFVYDREKKLATIGVGLTWAEVCEKMTNEDPEYTSKFPGVVKDVFNY